MAARSPKVIGGLLLALFLSVACEPPPPPHHQSAEAYLSRRRQARPLVDIAREAEAANDTPRALAAYELLLELWPDFAESRQGGVWRDGARRQRQRLRLLDRLSETHQEYLGLQERLRASQDKISRMDQLLHGALAPTSTSEPLSDKARRAVSMIMLRSALHSAHQGTLHQALEDPPTEATP